MPRGRPDAEKRRKRTRLNSPTCAKGREKAKTPNPTANLWKALPTIAREDQGMRETSRAATWSIGKDAKRKILLLSTIPPQSVLTNETKTTIICSTPILTHERGTGSEDKTRNKWKVAACRRERRRRNRVLSDSSTKCSLSRTKKQ